MQTSQTHIEPQTDNSQDIFIDPSIAHFMGIADHVKLQNLVATAQATSNLLVGLAILPVLVLHLPVKKFSLILKGKAAEIMK